VKLFLPTWQRHPLTIASTVVPILCRDQPQMSLTASQHGKVRPKRDASLLQCTLRNVAKSPNAHHNLRFVLNRLEPFHDLRRPIREQAQLDYSPDRRSSPDPLRRSTRPAWISPSGRVSFGLTASTIGAGVALRSAVARPRKIAVRASNIIGIALAPLPA
jgi:hypothetical protein